MWQNKRLKRRQPIRQNTRSRYLILWQTINKRLTASLKFWLYWWKWGLLGIGGITITIAAGYIYYMTPLANITNVVIERADQNIDAESVLIFFREQMIGKKILAINPKYIENQTRRQFPNIEEINITPIWPNTIKIRLKRYEIWGQASTTSNQLIYINTAGQMQIAQGGNIPTRIVNIIIPKNTKSYKIGNQIMSINDMLFLDKIWLDFFKYSQVLPEYIEYYQTERTAIIRASSGFDTWLTLTKSATEQLSKFKELEKVTSTRSAKFTYIDLRPKDRFIICYRAERCKPNKQQIFLGTVDKNKK